MLLLEPYRTVLLIMDTIISGMCHWIHSLIEAVDDEVDDVVPGDASEAVGNAVGKTVDDFVLQLFPMDISSAQAL